jgi:tetratricopeptide (TPR) repeat protein/transcriptional regulator with XRE-family HTH domain
MAGLTQEELAERAGLSVRNISNIERGRITRPRTDSLERLARALDLDDIGLRRLVDHYRRGHVSRSTVGVELLHSAPNQLPIRQTRFTGRSAYLARLDEHAQRGTDAAPVLVVDGIGGVGKTTLVLEWAHRARHLFPDGQLYVDLHGYGPLAPVDPATVLDSFLRALGVPGDQVPASTDARAGLFRSRLSDRRALIVLDNARTADQVRPLLPASDDCLVMVTSRRQLRGLSVRDGAQRITLHPFDEAEATTLLCHTVGVARVAAEPTAVAEIVRCCAGLPLAVNIVGERVARQPRSSLAGLAGQLGDTSVRLDLLDTGDSDQNGSVRAICSWSYDALDPEPARLFRLLALFPGAAFSLPVAAALAGVDEHTAGRTIDILTGSHLLEQDSFGRWEFHDLLRTYAAELAYRLDSEDARRAALVRLLDHYVDRTRQATALLEHDGEPAVAGVFAAVARALTWLNDERQNLVAAAISATQQGMVRYASDLSASLWRYLDTGAHYQDAQTLHSHAARTDDPAARGQALRYLGTACARMGHHDVALTHYETALDLARELNDRAAENRARNNLGIVYHKLGQHRRAEDQYRQVLRISDEIGDFDNKARALGNLGLIYATLGEYSRAHDHHERSVDLAHEIGNKRVETNQRDNLGTASRLLGRYREALEHHHGALAGYRQAGDRNGESDALSNLGMTYHSLMRHAEARSHYEQALDVAYEINNRLAEAKALNGLGETDLQDGRPAQAIEQHHRAIEALTDLAATPESARAHDGIARASTALGNIENARKHWQEALRQHIHLSAPQANTIRSHLDALNTGPQATDIG